MRITEDRERRREVLAHLSTEHKEAGNPHYHELWPCALRGAAIRYLRAAEDMTFPPDNRAALTFLRGLSHEDLLVQNEKAATYVRDGVTCRPDWWLGRTYRAFVEIKSTWVSAVAGWQLLERETVDLPREIGDMPGQFGTYFVQCLAYSYAVGVDTCGLGVYWGHGDYIDRRSACPNCKSKKLGPLVNDWSRTCGVCGYTGHTTDYNEYVLEFEEAEIDWIKSEIFTNRRDQFGKAIKAKSRAGVLRAAKPTPNYGCRSCTPGELIGCPEFGKIYAKAYPAT